MMMRPKSLHLPSAPQPTYSTSILQLQQQNVPVSPPSTPLVPNSPESVSSPPLYPSPTSSTVRPTSSTSTTAIKENVQVMVRLRPPSTKERQADEQPCWLVGPEPGMIRTYDDNRRNPGIYQYDAVVSGSDNQSVYNTGIGDLVKSTMAGYNGTVFAYGQTASGKTYTMMGTEDEPGVIPRAVNDLFTYIEEHPGREFLLRVSYMEIYKEKIHDLIAKADGLTPEIHEDKKRGVFVKNLREVIVVSPQQVLDVIREGEANRHVGETDYNTRSSRSHTIFQMVIESRNKNAYVPDQGSVRISQLNLIDLAGSEKAASDSERRQEGSYINKSLLALGNVISQLTNPKSSGNDKVFVQYRTSILTRVLQTALSGNARISVICTINPTWKCKTESTMTLRFAQRAKMIRTAAKMTRINEHSELQKCLNTIAELQTRMQEKTEQEVETRGRLNQLLGMILTSSKTSATTTAAVTKLATQVANGSGPLSRETIHDVFTQCEQGLTAHREEMARIQASLEAANKEKRELETQLQLMTKTSEDDRQQLEERLAASIKEAKEHEQEFLTRLQVLQEENRYLEANLATLQQAKAEHQQVMTEQLSQLQDENRQLEKSLKLALSEAEQHGNEQGKLATHLQNALDASKAETAELKAQLDSLKKDKEQAATTQLQQLQAQLAETRAQLIQQQQQSQHLDTELKTACEERDAYLAEIQEQRERTQELTGRMASLENARMLLLDKQEELMHVIHKQQSDNEDLQADLEEAQKQLEASYNKNTTENNNQQQQQQPPRPRRSLNASFGGSIVPNLMAAAAVYYAATLL